MTLLLSAESEGSGTDLLLPAAPELVWGLFAFIVLFLVMRKLVFPSLNATLEDRRALIEGKLEDADAKLVEMEEAKRTFEASLGDARGEAARILEEARSAAESTREAILESAQRGGAAHHRACQRRRERRAGPPARGAARPGRRALRTARRAHRRT